MFKVYPLKMPEKCDDPIGIRQEAVEAHHLRKSSVKKVSLSAKATEELLYPSLCYAEYFIFIALVFPNAHRRH